ncbi:MAG: hypothetical protein HC838_12675 [Spirulinaceae cyanobacterium RM2_2_10]|nr:hypothetical protein [Spirulinaceae cyanobacterium RM2_2_10]
MKTTVEIIAIIAIAAFAGNMINIGLSYARYWQSLEPTAFMENFKAKFIPYLLPPTAATLLPALIATLLSVVFNWGDPTARLFLANRSSGSFAYYRNYAGLPSANQLWLH